MGPVILTKDLLGGGWWFFWGAKSGQISARLKSLDQSTSTNCEPINKIRAFSLAMDGAHHGGSGDPSPKKGDSSQKENYRHVSCLPATSKLLEMVVNEQNSVFLESNNLLPRNQKRLV